MNIDHVFENNKTWVKDRLAGDPDYFKKLGSGQTPKILYIGCADSRVTAEELMGAEPGEVFVHRNIANVVSTDDLSVLSVVSYAVKHLAVDHVVVCGHTNCGGVKAAMQVDDLGILNPWLLNIQDVFRLHVDELMAIGDVDKRFNRLVELNVQEQCINLLKNIEIQHAIAQRGLKIHSWVFDLNTGKLKDLNLDLSDIAKKIDGVYRYRSFDPKR